MYEGYFIFKQKVNEPNFNYKFQRAPKSKCNDNNL